MQISCQFLPCKDPERRICQWYISSPPQYRVIQFWGPDIDRDHVSCRGNAREHCWIVTYTWNKRPSLPPSSPSGEERLAPDINIWRRIEYGSLRSTPELLTAKCEWFGFLPFVHTQYCNGHYTPWRLPAHIHLDDPLFGLGNENTKTRCQWFRLTAVK